MRTQVNIVHPLILRGESSAFERMERMYAEYNDPALNFWKDLLDYAENGFVRISPTSMALAKPCRDERGEYWFIRAAVGNLDELVSILPGFLPRIMWCRRNDGVIREYKTETLLRKVAAKMNRGK